MIRKGGPVLPIQTGGVIAVLAYLTAGDLGTGLHRNWVPARRSLPACGRASVGPITARRGVAFAVAAARQSHCRRAADEEAHEEAGQSGTEEDQSSEDRGDEDGDPEDPLKVEHGRHPRSRTAQPDS